MKQVAVAKAVIRNADGLYLVLRCSEWPERPDRSLKPDLAGGAVEEGETHAEGLVREIAEETGINVNAKDVTIGHNESIQYEDTLVNRHIYLVTVGKPEVVLSWEHDTYWWVPLDEMLKMEWREPYMRSYAYMQASGLLV